MASDTLPNIHSNFEIPTELDDSGSQIILQLASWVVVDTSKEMPFMLEIFEVLPYLAAEYRWMCFEESWK